MNDKQHALAAEIRAEMAAQRISATQMQRRTGIKHASWRNWLVTATRPVPYPELESVCAELGVPLAELLRRAEARLETMDPTTAQLEAGLSPGSRRALDRARAEMREALEAGEPQDPPSRGASEGARRSA